MRSKISIFVVFLAALVGIGLCESVNRAGRILGGYGAKSCSNFEYMVSIQHKFGDGKPFNHLCGGSLIHPMVVLTVAHCLKDASVSNWAVRVGSIQHGVGGQFINVQKMIKHNGYNEKNTIPVDNDVAILLLEKPVEMDDHCVSLIDLPDDVDFPPEPKTEMMISGWGRNSRDSKQLSPILRYTYIPVVSREECQKGYKGNTGESFICAGRREQGRDICLNDNGGPLVYTDRNTLAGIAVMGGFCYLNYPFGLYADVSHFLPWIRDQLQVNNIHL